MGYNGNRYGPINLGRTKHRHIRDMKEEQAREKLLWLIEHPDPAFEFFLDQYVGARNLGFKCLEARQIAQHITTERFYNIPYVGGCISTPATPRRTQYT